MATASLACASASGRRHDGQLTPAPTAACAAPSTPASRARKGSTWSSTGSMPSGRPARPISPARSPKAGSAVRDRYDDGGFSGGTLERPALKQLLADIEDGLIDVVVVYKIDRLSPLADGLLQAGRGVRPQQRDLRLGHAVLQHDHIHGAADAEHPAVLRPVRARGDRRTDPRQGGSLAQARHLDGRLCAPRLRCEGSQAGGERGRGRHGAADLRAVRRVWAPRQCWRGNCAATASATSRAR